MSLKAFLRKCAMQYFIITTCVTATIAILGLQLQPTARFGYEGFFSPLIFGLVSLIPSFVLYSRKELTLRQLLMRKVIYLVVLEAVLIPFCFWANLLHGLSDAAVFALGVLIVNVVINVINWLFGQREAEAINNSLKAFQERE